MQASVLKRNQFQLYITEEANTLHQSNPYQPPNFDDFS